MADALRSIRLVQFGCGYWGPTLLRNFTSLQGCAVKYLVEPDPARRRFAEASFPHTIVLGSVDRVLADPEVEGAIIATPATSHFALAKQALEAGKHVFVEKPLATTTAEVDQLAPYARAGLVVMVGHTFLYNSAVRYVRDLIAAGELGDVRYIHSQRLNLGRIRSDIDALWNFAPHDISIIQYWLGDPTPLAVHRHGMAYIQDGIEDVVFLNIVYPRKIIANIHVSWLDPQKTRRMTIVGSKRMVVYDDVAADKVAICDKGIDRRAILGSDMDFDGPHPAAFSYRSGDTLLPRLNTAEPVLVEAEHFLHCIRSGDTPVTGIEHARGVVSILERARPFADA